MLGMIRRKGFCKGCIQNTLQIRRIDSPLVCLLDWSTLRVASLFKLGPWYCTYCGASKVYLRSPVRGMRDFEADQESDQEVADELPIGNFILRDNSIVGSTNNTDRFSKKYRDGIVIKLLKGQSTMTQMCREINVSERDLMNWLREYVDDHQQLMAEEIEQLKLFISQANQETIALTYREQLEESLEEFENRSELLKKSRTIDGHIVDSRTRPAVE